jgi:hypothetical protein
MAPRPWAGLGPRWTSASKASRFRCWDAPAIFRWTDHLVGANDSANRSFRDSWSRPETIHSGKCRSDVDPSRRSEHTVHCNTGCLGLPFAKSTDPRSASGSASGTTEDRTGAVLAGLPISATFHHHETRFSM